MSDLRTLTDKLTVGIVQTTVDATRAWEGSARKPKMSFAQDLHVWLEICKAMRAFRNGGQKPRVIIFPELSLPRTRLDDFSRLVSALNAIAFVGVDYRLNHQNNIVQNQGVVFIPRGFFQDHSSRYCSRVIFGKTFASPKEKYKLGELNPAWSFRGDHNVYVFDCAKYGNIGVSICYDFMDIERALMYRGAIQHLFVLAYNRDLGMFRSLADSLSRTVFCNVVICNTGHFGGSLAVSPYYEAYRRVLYAHDGKNLFTTQVVDLPVRDLVQAQQGTPRKYEKTEKVQEFKERPPGLIERPKLIPTKVKLK